jgi:hypothetical protein
MITLEDLLLVREESHQESVALKLFYKLIAADVLRKNTKRVGMELPLALVYKVPR